MRSIARRPAASSATRPSRPSAFHSTPLRTPHVLLRPSVLVRAYALDPPLADEEVKLKHLPREKRPEHWKAKLSSRSEAIVKAEREPEKTPEELRRQGYQHLKKREFEDRMSPNNEFKRAEPSANVMGGGTKETPEQKVRSEQGGAGSDKSQKTSQKRDAPKGDKKRANRGLKDTPAASPS